MAERAADTFARARAGVAKVIFRPGRGDRADAGDAAGGRPRPFDRRAGPRQDAAGRDAGHRARARLEAHPVHPRPDAGRHHRLGCPGRGRRQALVPLPQGSGLHPAFDGGRDQPRFAAHPIGSAAGDAGAPGHRRGPALRPADAVSRARDPEPAGAGRQPIPCPRPSSTASCCRSTSAIPTRTPRSACSSPPPSAPRARPSASARRRSCWRRNRSCAISPSARKSSTRSLKLVRAARPDADGPKDLQGAIAWAPGPRASQAFMLAVRARALISGRLAPSTDDVVALAHPVLRPPHGAFLLRPRRGDDARKRHRPSVPGPSLIQTRNVLQDEAEALSAALPPLLVDAERLASAVSLGIHGRRKAGMGESFWQFAASAPRIRRPPSIGGSPPSRSISSCASANGKWRSRYGSGATARRA